MKPVVIVPTYNERDNIDILLDDLLSLPVNLSVINVDDNSPDGTGEAADAWAARYPDRVSGGPSGRQTGPGHGVYRRLQARVRSRLRSHHDDGRRLLASSALHSRPCSI